MKRDMEIIRRIALAVEEVKPGYALTFLDDITDTAFAMHALWMQEAGLVQANIQEFASGAPASVRIRRLTWAGCEFVDAIRDDKLWKRAMAHVSKSDMSFTFDVLKEWLKKEITRSFPTLWTLSQQTKPEIHYPEMV